MVNRCLKGNGIMKREFIRNILETPEKYDGREVILGGWVRSLRDSKAFAFMDLNDGSSFQGVQIVLEREHLPEFDTVVRYQVGAAVIVRGKVLLTPNAKQPLEIHAASVQLEGASSPDYPLQKKRHSVEFLRQIAYLRPRTNLFSAVFRIRSETAYAIHQFFHERGFVYVHTPIITASDCEGAGETFRVTTLDISNLPRTDEGTIDWSHDFFGIGANLTVSGQLEGETFAQAFGKIYTFGPTFRAENSNTARHAAEFWMIEPEIAFADLSDDMALAWDMVQYILRHVLQQCSAELSFLNQFVDRDLLHRLEALAGSECQQVTYTQAVELLEKSGHTFQYPAAWGRDLQTEHERYLTEEVFHGPVFVTDYPKEIKSFYMRLNDDGKTVAAMDLLVPGVGEIIGGSQREERLEVLLARMKECGLREEDYDWYVNLRRWGSTRHAGFGLGFERMVMYLTGVANIRDVIPYPRTAGSAPY